ncbi:cytochrome c oxidase subunit I [Silvibacterium dinghuense]|uniref:Cytochrome c oxidase subunit I n=1 Tax=Silvibacterium dinghuense TaxID=1560006 RepID=A0A4Q1SD55_9BACT|nr:cbb3-type cytochrome c oxidase subunit I [Silvibacterium dinghuense]RXS95152.1 cytochrome c oxidase subunit I [Silvibacterium dinghuense]GGH11070.1 cytochrome-c oxidase [Silvibacterium dinghuense]
MSRIFTTDHRRLGVLYLYLSLAAVVVGTLLSLLIRIHRIWPDWRLPVYGLMKPEDYLALVTMHGTLMVFFVLTTAPQSGFANLVLPAQIGGGRMAFPRLNAAAFWLAVLSFVVLLAAFFVPQGAPISGWTHYPPMSAVSASGPGQGAGMDIWLASIGIFCLSAWLSAVNLLATILTQRCSGMSWTRMPMTVWGWMVASILTLLAFSVLLAALLLLFSDRHLGSSFFVPMGDLVNGRIVGHGDGSPLLWLHLFWFFGHPEVYIAILPGMGLATSIFANFARRTVRGYRTMAGMLVAIGGLGLLVWGHHMFVSGMNPYAGTAFALTTMAIAVPSTVEVLGWLALLSRGGLRLTTPMLFALGFLSFFIAGGLTGPLLAQPALDGYLHNTFFVVGHFHLVMAMAGVFSIFAGIYYWFPLLTGRRMNELAGKLHFWISLFCAYGTFLPMYFSGLAGEPRHYERLAGPATNFAGILANERGITFSALTLGAAQLLFLWNVFHSARRGEPAGQNPWQATTLEWAPPDAPLRVTHGPYDYEGFSAVTKQDTFSSEEILCQWEAASKQE